MAVGAGCTATFVPNTFLLASSQCSSSVIYARAIISYNDRNYKWLSHGYRLKTEAWLRRGEVTIKT